MVDSSRIARLEDLLVVYEQSVDALEARESKLRPGRDSGKNEVNSIVRPCSGSGSV